MTQLQQQQQQQTMPFSFSSFFSSFRNMFLLWCNANTLFQQVRERVTIQKDFTLPAQYNIEQGKPEIHYVTTYQLAEYFPLKIPSFEKEDSVSNSSSSPSTVAAQSAVIPSTSSSNSPSHLISSPNRPLLGCYTNPVELWQPIGGPLELNQLQITGKIEKLLNLKGEENLGYWSRTVNWFKSFFRFTRKNSGNNSTSSTEPTQKTCSSIEFESKSRVLKFIQLANFQSNSTAKIPLPSGNGNASNKLICINFWAVCFRNFLAYSYQELTSRYLVNEALGVEVKKAYEVIENCLMRRNEAIQEYNQQLVNLIGKYQPNVNVAAVGRMAKVGKHIMSPFNWLYSMAIHYYPGKSTAPQPPVENTNDQTTSITDPQAPAPAQVQPSSQATPLPDRKLSNPNNAVESNSQPHILFKNLSQNHRSLIQLALKKETENIINIQTQLKDQFIEFLFDDKVWNLFISLLNSDRTFLNGDDFKPVPTFLRVGVEPDDEFFSCYSDLKATETVAVVVGGSEEPGMNVLRERGNTTGNSSKPNSLDDDIDSPSSEPPESKENETKNGAKKWGINWFW